MGGRQVRTDKKYGEIYDHHYVEFEFPDGTRMYSQCRHIPGVWNSVTEHAHGSNGGIADISGGRIELPGGYAWRYRGGNPNPYQVEHDVLFKAIRENTSHNEGETGAMSTMAAILGRMCTYSGDVIEWDAALNSDKSLMPKEFAWDAEPPTKPDKNGHYPIPMPGLTEVL